MGLLSSQPFTQNAADSFVLDPPGKRPFAKWLLRRRHAADGGVDCFDHRWGARHIRPRERGLDLANFVLSPASVGLARVPVKEVPGVAIITLALWTITVLPSMVLDMHDLSRRFVLRGGCSLRQSISADLVCTLLSLVVSFEGRTVPVAHRAMVPREAWAVLSLTTVCLVFTITTGRLPTT